MDGDRAVRAPRPRAAAAFLAVGLLAGGAAAQSTALVSNSSKNVSTNGVAVGAFNNFQISAAQAFTTGDSTAGYVLESVTLGSTNQHHDVVLDVSVHDESGNLPGDLVVQLSGDAGTTSGLTNTYTAPADTVLVAGTTYLVVVQGGERSARMQITEDKGEDDGSASGWSIADSRLSRNADTAAWTSLGSNVLRMTVTGCAFAAPDAPTNLAATAVSPTQVDLSWEAPTGCRFVAGYEVEFSSSAGGPWTPAGTPGGTTFSHLWCAATTTCHYRVRATNAAGGSDWATASATTLARDAEDETVWSTTMTAGLVEAEDEDETGDGRRSHGFDSVGGGDVYPPFGSISGSAEFTYEGTTHTVWWVSETNSYGPGYSFVTREFRLDPALPEQPDDLLVLVLDGVEYRLDEGGSAPPNYAWYDPGFTLLWSEGQKVSVRLIARDPLPPTPPRNVAATGGDRSAKLTWSQPVNGGTHTVTKFQYRHATGGHSPEAEAEWTDVPESGIDEANRNGFTLAGLANDLAHRIELRAFSAAGASEAASVDVIPRSASGAVLGESVAVLGNLDEETHSTALTIAADVTYTKTGTVADGDRRITAEVNQPGYRYAQTFSTGADGHLFRVDSVEVKFVAGGGGTDDEPNPAGDVMHVQLVEWDPRALRQTRQAGTFEARQAEAGDTRFRYLGREYLKASTFYAIRITAAYKDSTSATLAQTTSEDEDDGGQPGWQLVRGGSWRQDAFAPANAQWIPLANSLQVRIHARRGAGGAGLHVHDAEVYEAHGATLDFKVTLDPAPKSGETVTVQYRSRDSSSGYCSRAFRDEGRTEAEGGPCLTTARYPSDYLPVQDELTFAADETLKTVSVPVVDDHVEDSGEGVELLLFTPRAKGGADVPALARDAALGTIYNHEEAAEPSEVRVSDARAAEGGELLFVASLSTPATATVTVDYATSGGTATAGVDYTETSGTLTFAAGETSRTASVPAHEDGTAEGDETLTLTLDNVVHAVFAGNAASVSATGTIAGNVAVGGVADDGAMDEGETDDSGTEEGGTDDSQADVSEADEAGVLTGFTLVDAATGLDVGTIANGRSFALPDPESGSWGIRAEAATGAEIGSVRLELSGAKAHERTENHPPWSLYGDDGGAVHGAGLPEGAYTLRATAHAEGDLGGAELQALEVSFAVAALPPLTATFRDVPDGHDGATAFTFEVLFSEPVPTSYTVLRDDGAFEVAGGTVTRARRVDGRDDLREIHIKPGGQGAVTVTLPPTTDCRARGAVCMDDGRKLSAGDTATVAGPVAAAVVDGRLVTLRWRSPPDAFAAPDGSDFAVTADGVLRPVASVSFHAHGVSLLLSAPVGPDQAVSVDHLGSAMHPPRSAAGALRPPWRGLAARNVSGWSAEERSAAGVVPPAPNPAPTVWNASRSASLAGRELDSTELAALAAMTDLRRLDLSDTGLSDLSSLSGLVGLESLDLSGNAVADLAPLAGLVELRRLDLGGNRIGELWPLGGLPNLEVLLLDGNRVSELGALTPPCPSGDAGAVGEPGGGRRCAGGHGVAAASGPGRQPGSGPVAGGRCGDAGVAGVAVGGGGGAGAPAAAAALAAGAGRAGGLPGVRAGRGRSRDGAVGRFALCGAAYGQRRPGRKRRDRHAPR